MNFRTTLVLLVLVLLVGAGWLASARLRPADPASPTLAFLDKELQADKLTRIEIKRGKNQVVLERTGDEWSLPGKWPVRKFEVKQLLQALDDLQSRYAPIPLDAKADLKKFGLDANPLHIDVHFGTTAYTLLLAEDPQDTNRFARPTYMRMGKKAPEPAWENEVVRLGPGLVSLLDRPTDYYQQRRLFPAERIVKKDGSEEEVEELVANAIAIKSPDANFTLTWDAGDVVISAPVRDRVNPDKLRSILAGMPDIWAEYFVDKKKGLEDFGLNEPEQTITVTRLSGATVTLLVGKVADTKVRVVQKPAPPQFGPQGKPQMDVIHEEFRFAKLQDNEQIFAIKADKLKDIALSLDSLRDSQLARFKTDDVKRVELKHDKQELVLVKDKDKWRLQKPKEQDAETSAVTELLDKLAGLNVSGKDIIDKADPKDYGLDQPATVKIALEEGKAKKPREITFQLGKKPQDKKQKDQDKEKVFIQVAGWPRVNAIDDAVWKLVQRPALAYRNRRLLDFKTADLEKLEIQRPSETYALEQTKGTWRLTKPAAADVDATKAEQLAGDLSRLEVVEFVTDAPKPEDVDKQYGLAKPDLTARLSLSAKKDIILKLGKQREGKQEYFAQLEGEGIEAGVFVVKKDVRESLDRDSLALRPLSIWQLATGDIRDVKIHKDGVDFRLKKDGETWKVAGTFEAPALTEEVLDLTDVLATLRAEKYVAHSAKDKELAKFGLEKPYLTISVAPAKEKEKERVLHVGQPTEKDAKSRFAKLGDSDAVFVVGEKTLTVLDHSALDFLDRKLLALDAKKIRRVTSKNPAGSFTLQEQKGEWEIVDSPAPKFQAESDAASSFLRPWANLRAEKYAAYGSKIDWSAFGLDKPAPTVTVTVEGEDKEKPTKAEHTLALGSEVKDSPGRHYARLDKQDAVVILDAEASKELKRTHLDFISRAVLKYDLDTVTAIHRSLNGAELEITKKDDAWKVTKPSEHPADTIHTEAVLEKTFRLQAERIAAYPAKDLKQFGLDKPAAVVTLKLNDSQGKAVSHVLKVGATVKDGEERYALVNDGDKVFVLAKDLSHHLTAPALHFRDHNLTTFSSADKVVLERGTRKATFRKVDGAWKMTEPTAADAEDAELDEFVRSLARLRADDIVAEKPAKLETFGLEKPQAIWRFSAGDKELLALTVGSATKGKEQEKKKVVKKEKEQEKEQEPEKMTRVHARLSNTELIVVLNPKLSAKALTEYRSRKVWKAPDAVQVEKITFGYQKSPFTLQKVNNTWQVEGNADAKVDEKAVTDALDALAGLQAERFAVDKGADLQLYGLKPPVLTIELQTATAKKVLHLGRNEGESKRFYATSPEAEGTPVFIISEPDGRRIVRSLSAFLQGKEPEKK